MALDDARSIFSHFNGLKSDRSVWECLWQEVSDYGLARRSFSKSFLAQGQGKRTRHIYDNTMMVANELLSAGLHNIMTPTSSAWLHAEPADPKLMSDGQAADWYAEVETLLAQEINRYESGFHTQIAETYTDIAAFGNGGLITRMDEDKNLLFQSAPLAETYVEEDQYGRVERIYGYREWSAAEIVARWGPGLHKDADDAIGRGQLGQRFPVINALIPNPLFDARRRFGAGVHQVASWWIDGRKGDLIKKEFFREMPTAFARWNKDSDELYGRGPGVQALSDQRMLSAMNKVTLTGAEKAVNPPMVGPDSGFITQLDMSPGGYTVARQGTGDQLRPLYDRPGQGVELGVELGDRRQANIRAAYHFELLQMIQDPRMSATQVLELSSRVQQILSPAAASLQAGLLQPTVTRSFNLMLRGNRFPAIPPQLRGTEVRFRYVSPVQRAQRATEARTMIEAINGAIQLAQLDPKALDPIDGEQVTRFLWAAHGLPPHLLRTPQEVERLTAGRAAMQQQQEQQAQMMGAAEAMGKAAPALQLLQGGGNIAA